MTLNNQNQRSRTVSAGSQPVTATSSSVDRPPISITAVLDSYSQTTCSIRTNPDVCRTLFTDNVQEKADFNQIIENINSMKNRNCFRAQRRLLIVTRSRFEKIEDVRPGTNARETTRNASHVDPKSIPPAATAADTSCSANRSPNSGVGLAFQPTCRVKILRRLISPVRGVYVRRWQDSLSWKTACDIDETVVSDAPEFTTLRR